MAASDDFPASRAEGLRRLDAFLPHAGRDYAAGRNADLGAGERGNVSVLSPYLRYRLITEDEVVGAVLQRHGGAVASKFVQEVGWRTYWKGWLELRPAVWRRFQAERDAAREGGTGLAQAVQEAEAGVTGIEGFDDWARELVAHGYLHNHARMWFASIWVFTLGLPWALGADFFLRHLVDGDPASNTLSWRWVAGLQTPGKTYLATADNIARYTEGRFHPVGLATRAVAIREDAPLPKVRPLTEQRPAAGPALLLVHGDDLSPESLLPEELDVRGVMVREGAEGWPWGDKAGAFLAGAVADCAGRLRERFGRDVAVAEDAAAVVAAAKQAGAAMVWTPYAPVGPAADWLDGLAGELAAEGVELVRARRDWDEQLWPHATKGYFAFREGLSAVVGGGGLAR